MTAFWLRAMLALSAFWWVVFVLLAYAAGLAIGAAVALVTGVWFAAILLNSAIRQALSLSDPAARRRALTPGLPRVLAAFFAEVLAFLAVFTVIQPFERSWMGGEPGTARVVLVHGYGCNRGSWWWIRRRLRARGIEAATLNLEPPLSGIDTYAQALHDRIESLSADRLLLVGHSMGGLVCRAYLRRYGTARIARLVTLATPHHGSRVARFAFGRDAREMEPNSAWLRDLGFSGLTVPTHTVWSSFDELVVPQDSALLVPAEQTVLHALGHLAFLFSPRVLRVIEAEAARC